MQATQDFWATPGGWTLLTVAQIVFIAIVVMVSVAFLIYGERKLFAGAQMRKRW